MGIPVFIIEVSKTKEGYMSDMIEMNKPLECDVLVAGGGVAGLMAAIAAAEEGAKVIVAEKANSKRSGSGATGNDHFLCYIPAVHGDDPSEFIREMEESQIGGNNDMERNPLTG